MARNKFIGSGLMKKASFILNYIGLWILSFSMFALLRGLGTENTGVIQASVLDTAKIILFQGTIMGLLTGVFQMLLEEILYHKIAFSKLIILKTLITVLLSLLFLIGTYFYFKVQDNIEIGLVGFLLNPASFAIIIFILLIDAFLSFLRKIGLMLGKNTLRNLLNGKYHRPLQEERIFMFLDLRSSTTIAEDLGYEKYSLFIQECFVDLGVIENYKVQIYQYVGDEAVLTWKVSDCLENQNCLMAFFSFKDELKRKEQYYLDTYGHFPFFKAGAHVGPVIATEVGKYKKEIAYHGDTINTAARIQAKCNEFGADFIISEKLKDLVNKTHMICDSLGAMKLKGKEELTTLYSVKNKKVVFIN